LNEPLRTAGRTRTTVARPAVVGACLRVEGVAFRYPHFELTQTNFEAGAGELVAIIGPNGSGKSTLLEIVSGHLKPLSGRVFLDGEDLHRLPQRRRTQRVGLARQDAPLLFSFEVREFVRQGRHPHVGRLFESPADEQWVQWALEKTNLTALAARPITEVSGGEFQRAVLARTLAQRPRLVLLDEPTANLDIGYQIEMLRLLRELAAREGFVAIIVTHELNLAAEFADLPALTRRRTMRPPRDSQPRLGLGPAEPGVPEAGAGGPESVKRPPRVTWVMP